MKRALDNVSKALLLFFSNLKYAILNKDNKGDGL